jgi:hypothetical protein
MVRSLAGVAGGLGGLDQDHDGGADARGLGMQAKALHLLLLAAQPIEQGVGGEQHVGHGYTRSARA